MLRLHCLVAMATPLMPAQDSVINLPAPFSGRRNQDGALKSPTPNHPTMTGEAAGNGTEHYQSGSNNGEDIPSKQSSELTQKSEKDSLDTYLMNQESPDKVQRSTDTTNPVGLQRSSSVASSNSSGAGQENEPSTTKNRHSRVLSGTELSPLKLLGGSRVSPDRDIMTVAMGSRKLTLSEKRFPIRINSPNLVDGQQQQQQSQSIEISTESTMDRQSQKQNLRLQDAIKSNPGLAKAIEIFEDDDSLAPDDFDGQDDNENRDVNNPTTDQDNRKNSEDSDYAVNGMDDTIGPDDTVLSTFSTFSAIPNMTMFAEMGQSPTKPVDVNSATPRAPSTTKGPVNAPDVANTTSNLLLDFTDHLRFPQKSPVRRNNMSPVRGVPATPQRGTTGNNLLDFDIPPLPTPRSIPTITPRELESLKSNFLSEISSLKASLSGKEAEVQSLKTAVGDAEKRVGQCMEQFRESQTSNEQLISEKDGWERRSREMEAVLRKVKDEIAFGQREREELEHKLEESEKRREAAEMMAQDAESKMAGLRAGKAAEEKEREANGDKTRSPTLASSASNTAREVEQAVERVARELHALYKGKHETKVAALKKSYETRWEKRVHELEARISQLGDDNERLHNGKDSVAARMDAAQLAANAAKDEERKAQAVRDSAQIRELKADVERLMAVTKSVQQDNDELRSLLEKERVEKGELVQLAEEMMSMQTIVAGSSGAQQQQPRQQPRPTSMLSTPQQPQTPRRQSHPPKSGISGLASPAVSAKTPNRVSRVGGIGGGLSSGRGLTSGLRAPGESKIGGNSSSNHINNNRAAAAAALTGGTNHERTKSVGGAGIPRPGSGYFGARSGIMSSIERMGSYRGRPE